MKRSRSTGKAEQITGLCVLCAAIFFIAAAVELQEIMEPRADCERRSPLEAAPWFCLALGFAVAGLSQRRLRGAAYGAALVLIPSVVFLLLTEGDFTAIGCLAFVGIMAAVVYNAIAETIRGP